jgi:hypothetical protein
MTSLSLPAQKKQRIFDDKTSFLREKTRCGEGRRTRGKAKALETFFSYWSWARPARLAHVFSGGGNGVGDKDGQEWVKWSFVFCSKGERAKVCCCCVS